MRPLIRIKDNGNVALYPVFAGQRFYLCLNGNCFVAAA